MFVLGIDPGLTATGYGIIEATNGRERALVAGVIRTDPAQPTAERLRELSRDLGQLIAEHPVTAAGVEQVFANRNLHTAMSVARASGVVLLTLAQAAIGVSEYTPSGVKMALTGNGRAGKEQVQRVVAMRLGLAVPPGPADAADALAVALCHLQHVPALRAGVVR